MTQSPEMRIAKAEQLLGDDKVYEAIGELETLIKENPAHYQAHVQLGLLNMRLGAIAKGRESIQKALPLAPTHEDKNKLKSILREQDHIDQKRFYRPDFEALRKANGVVAFKTPAWWIKFMSLFREEV